MVIDEAQNLEYSPSKWSRNPKVIEDHLIRSIRVTNMCRETIPCQLNNKYGDEVDQVYDLYGTDLPHDAAILVYIHGGYWQEPKFRIDVSGWMARPLYDNGIVNVVVDYPLAPSATLSQIEDSIVLLGKHVIDLAMKRGARGVYLCGWSAGAHLVLRMLGHENIIRRYMASPIIKGIFLIEGVFDLVPLLATEVNIKLQLTPEEAVQHSVIPKQLSTYENVPFLFFMGEHNSKSFSQQSADLHQILASLNKKSVFHNILNVDHFTIIEGLSNVNFSVMQKILELCN